MPETAANTVTVAKDPDAFHPSPFIGKGNAFNCGAFARTDMGGASVQDTAKGLLASGAHLLSPVITPARTSARGSGRCGRRGRQRRFPACR